MAWLQVHQTLKDHRKLFDAADALEIPPAHMMGLLVSFWMWALDNAPDGNLNGITPRMIARAAQWEGGAEKFTEALKNAGFLDIHEDGTLEIHDWYEYAGKLIDRRVTERERSRSRRAAAAASADGTAADQQTTDGQMQDGQKKASGKSRVDQSRAKKKGDPPPSPSDEGATAGKESVIDARFAEFWSAYPKKVAKQYALKAWKRLKPDADLHDKIMRAVEAQKRSEQWRRENGRYIPNPATWLNGGQWDNETEEVTQDAAAQRDPEQSGAGDAGKDWTKGFKPADDPELDD